MSLLKGSDLIMDLTLEQGEERITQVQPPVGAWANYFDIDFEYLPTLTLRNMQDSTLETEERPVVRHDHNWTLEISAATVNRPAIIRFRCAGKDTYQYWIHDAGEPEYDRLDYILNTFPNPHWRRGRRWLII